MGEALASPSRPIAFDFVSVAEGDPRSMTAPAVQSFQGSGEVARYAEMRKTTEANSPSTTKDRYIGSSESPRFPSFCPRQTDRRIKLERLLYRLNEMEWQISDSGKEGENVSRTRVVRRAYVSRNEIRAIVL